MNTQTREIDRAPTSPADPPSAHGSRLPAILPGAVGLTVGVLSATPTGATHLGWGTPYEPMAAGAAGLAAALMCLAVVVATRHLVVFQAAGRRIRGGTRWRSRSRWLDEPADELADELAGRGPSTTGCPVAHGSGTTAGSSRGSEPRATEVDRAEAEDFLRMFHAENPQAGPVEPRIAEAMREIDTTGIYWHTREELAFGARAAWRNNARCIGRLYWRSLQVRDLRTVTDPAGVARHCFEHLGRAFNGGKIRPMISVFAPETPTRPAPRIWNEQLIRYAGYRQPDGSVLGDPRYRAFTREMILRGWRPPRQRGAFDVLPLVVETAEEGPQMFPVPVEVVQEVELVHPELPWFADLGMRWHAVPVISNNTLVIGGVSYPAAPFNGWYMGTEIGARNLADNDRYDMVPVVAERLGLDTADESSLWRDRSLVEINRAVLHSFQANGVSITDHHTESRRFLTHVEREERAGRGCPADWSWIVPPMSSAQTPVFHRYYDSEDRRPNFFADDETARRGLQGGPPAFA